MKKCTLCGELKELSFFTKHNETKDGLDPRCNKCRAKNNKKYSEYFKQYGRKRNTFLKKAYGISVRAINTYGLKLALEIYDRSERRCEKCGEVNDLTIHHIDGNGRHNLEKGLPQNNNTENLMVLCRKCHGSIHGKQSANKRKERLCQDSMNTNFAKIAEVLSQSLQ